VITFSIKKIITFELFFAWNVSPLEGKGTDQGWAMRECILEHSIVGSYI